MSPSRIKFIEKEGVGFEMGFCLSRPQISGFRRQ